MTPRRVAALLTKWREEAQALQIDVRPVEDDGRADGLRQCADELEAALLADPEDAARPAQQICTCYIGDVESTASCPVHARQLEDAARPATTLETPLTYLRAYGEEESAKTLVDKDWNNHQFWAGWLSALDRAIPIAEAMLAARPAASAVLTDEERYDHATALHATERAREYERTLWAAAAAHWPEPLRIPRVCRDAWAPGAQLQTCTDHRTRELLIYAPRPGVAGADAVPAPVKERDES